MPKSEAMPRAILPPGTKPLGKKDAANKFVIAGLVVIVLLGAFLRFFQLGSLGYGNEYYAATVKSMLTSWHNFFYASFEPGGSVSVDKPPLGFWVEAFSAKILGVNGFALALPNALAGVLSILLVFSMVRKQFGAGAALLGALVVAATPIAIATDRNNTIDGMLVFVLLLSAWFLLRSIEKGRWGYLVLSLAMVGLGFNIKMLQATMILPALYLVYILFAPFKWWKRILHLLAATVVLVVISLAWIVVVDLTPADQRPYVGSSMDNTEIELIIGHNGLERLGLNRLLQTSNRGLDNFPPRQMPAGGTGNPLPGTRGANPPLLPPKGQAPYSGQPGTAPNPGGINPNPMNTTPNPGQGSQRQNEVGIAGVLRLFTQPLSDQASWMLPMVLPGMILCAFVLPWKKPLGQKHIGLVLWASWLLPMVVYFSFTTGLWHTYYLIMLVPGMAGLAAASGWALWQVLQGKRWLGWGLVFLLSSLTLAFQAVVLLNFPEYTPWVGPMAGFLWLAGMILLAMKTKVWALGIVMLSLLVAPITWSFLTTFNPLADAGLPKAGPAENNPKQGSNPGNLPGNTRKERLVDFLLKNTEPGTYLVAVRSANEAAPFILATGRPVLTFGGFTGSDDIIDAQGLAEMVSTGELRYIIGDDQLARSHADIASWMKVNCEMVNTPGTNLQGKGSPPVYGGIPIGNGLYDCGQP